MNFCSHCGQPTSLIVPPDDNRERYYCPACGSIHYINPKVIVGCLPVWENKIMLCKRGIEPQLGYWTLPGGFLEMDETTEQGAVRETWEETGARVDIERLLGVYNMPQINQIYFIYLANMRSADFELTPESTEIRLVEPKDIPWHQMAFKVMSLALRQYVDGEPENNPAIFHSDIMIPNYTQKPDYDI